MGELGLLNKLINYVSGCNVQVDLVYLYTETLKANMDDKHKKEILDILNRFVVHKDVDKLYSDLVCEADMILESGD